MKINLSYVFLFFLGIISTFIGFNIVNNSRENDILSSQINSEQEAVKIKDDCKNSSDKKNCYSRLFYNLALKKGYDSTFEIFQLVQQSDPDALDCHFIAHEIGKGAYRYDPKNWGNVIAKADVSCSYGIGHGMIEAYLSTLPSSDVLDEKTLVSICNQEAGLSCNHVVGHVLMVEYAGELKPSLEKCGVYQNLGKISCQNGVFMEHITPTTLVEHGLADKSLLQSANRLDSLVELCNSYHDKQLAYICWGELASPVLGKYHKEPTASLDFCSNAPFQDAVRFCRRRIIHILSAAKRLDYESLKPICKNAPTKDMRNACITHLAFGQVRQMNGNENSIIKMCDSIRDISDKELCLIASVQIIKTDEYAQWQSTAQSLCQEIVTPTSRNRCYSNL